MPPPSFILSCFILRTNWKAFIYSRLIITNFIPNYLIFLSLSCNVLLKIDFLHTTIFYSLNISYLFFKKILIWKRLSFHYFFSINLLRYEGFSSSLVNENVKMAWLLLIMTRKLYCRSVEEHNQKHLEGSRLNWVMRGNMDWRFSCLRYQKIDLLSN